MLQIFFLRLLSMLTYIVLELLSSIYSIQKLFSFIHLFLINPFMDRQVFLLIADNESDFFYTFQKVNYYFLKIQHDILDRFRN